MDTINGLESLDLVMGMSADIALYLLLFLGFVWIVFIIWVVKDITQRTDNLVLQIISILLITILTPIIGLPIYLAIRPVIYKKDTIPWREANASMLLQCDNCSTLNPKDYKYCVECGHKMTVQCKECKESIPYSYSYCYKCGAPNIG